MGSLACGIRSTLAALILGGVLSSVPSAAEQFAAPLLPMPSAVVSRATGFATDLIFPEAAEPGTGLTRPRQAFLKPSGDGPFPALVLLHQCAGVNAAVASWARDAVERGYVVLMIDSLTPRDVKTVCFGPRAGVNVFRGARDAFQAAEHLRKYPFVDAARVSFVGFSWGATVGLVVSSARYAAALNGKPFARVVSFYPGCFRVARPNAPTFDLVSDDMMQPVLVLMGQSDLETPPGECTARLEMAKAAGSLVEWHVYPETGHCWDCRQLDGFTKVDVRGTSITYAYSEQATRDSALRLYAFLAASGP